MEADGTWQREENYLSAPQTQRSTTMTTTTMTTIARCAVKAVGGQGGDAQSGRVDDVEG